MIRLRNKIKEAMVEENLSRTITIPKGALKPLTAKTLVPEIKTSMDDDKTKVKDKKRAKIAITLINFSFLKIGSMKAVQMSNGIAYGANI
jgi:hypothetical protein